MLALAQRTCARNVEFTLFVVVWWRGSAWACQARLADRRRWICEAHGVSSHLCCGSSRNCGRSRSTAENFRWPHTCAISCWDILVQPFLGMVGSGEETAYMSLCSWGQWLVMWAFCMTWRCWFCLVPHEEYLSLVCEQKATKQVEFIRLMAEILHHFWLDGISLHPLNLNIGGIQMQETDAVMNGWNPAPPSMSSQHWNYGGCRGKHQRCYNAIHGRRCRISAINSTQTDL